ncbi:hypothetical protein KCU62_g68, partial [Aureobasidium sp. EXF-3399]
LSRRGLRKDGASAEGVEKSYGPCPLNDVSRVCFRRPSASKHKTPNKRRDVIIIPATREKDIAMTGRSKDRSVLHDRNNNKRCLRVFAFLPVVFFFFEGGPSTTPGTGVAAPEGLYFVSTRHQIIKTEITLTFMVHVIHADLLLLRRSLPLLCLVRFFGLLLGKFSFFALNFGGLIIIGQPQSNVLRAVLSRPPAPPSTLANALLDSTTCDETIDRDLSCLTETMRTIHGLGIDGGVPITVVEDDSVGRSKVDTKTASASTDVSTVLELCRTIQTAVLVVAPCLLLIGSGNRFVMGLQGYGVQRVSDGRVEERCFLLNDRMLARADEFDRRSSSCRKRTGFDITVTSLLCCQSRDIHQIAQIALARHVSDQAWLGMLNNIKHGVRRHVTLAGIEIVALLEECSLLRLPLKLNRAIEYATASSFRDFTGRVIHKTQP